MSQVICESKNGKAVRNDSGGISIRQPSLPPSPGAGRNEYE